jgi:hypothetical protein
MIALIDEALTDFLAAEIVTIADIPLPDFDIDIKIPSKSWSDALSDKTKVNLYLFDLRENTELRQTAWEEEQAADRVERKRPPVRIDLFYMITTYCTHFTIDYQNELMEHHLLSYTLAVVHKFPTMPPSYLGGLPSLPDIPIETVHPEFLDEQGGFQIWSALEQKPRPAVFMKVTIPLELDVAFSETAVFTKQLGFRQFTAADTSDVMIDLGGLIVDTGHTPVADATVTLSDDEGDVTDRVQTDTRGRFTFRNVTGATVQISAAADGYLPTTPLPVKPAEAESAALILQLAKA